MIHAPSLLQQSRTSAPRWDGSGLFRAAIIQWCLLLALPLVGMLLLLACFLLQGVFAALGPVVIFVGAKLIAKRIETTASG